MKMSNVSTKKVFIQIESAAEQQENLKNQRKTFKVLQSGVAPDKENLAGRPQIDKLSRLKAATESTLASAELAKRKKVETRASETQTSPQKKANAVLPAAITAADLTSEDKPSEFYWERLAEKRREALEETLGENQRLHERIEGLEAELNTSRQMLEEARNLVDVLTEMLNENEAEREIEVEAGAAQSAVVGVKATNNDENDEDDDSNITKSSAAELTITAAGEATDDQELATP